MYKNNPINNEINSGDIIELHKRIELLNECIENMRKVHKDFNPDKEFTIFIPDIYITASKELIKENKERQEEQDLEGFEDILENNITE